MLHILPLGYCYQQTSSTGLLTCDILTTDLGVEAGIDLLDHTSWICLHHMKPLLLVADLVHVDVASWHVLVATGDTIILCCMVRYVVVIVVVARDKT